ncbi:MAG: BLUF domain-containing protein [Bdellovibrionota bacterium]
MPNSIFTLVYTSKSRKKIDQELLTQLLKVARTNNARDDITGFLTVRGEYFAQLLEGPEDKVRACYERIAADRRHTQIVLQGESHSETRIMASWNMALVETPHADHSGEQLIDLFELGRAGGRYADSTSLHDMLRVFSREAQILEI